MSSLTYVSVWCKMNRLADIHTDINDWTEVMRRLAVIMPFLALLAGAAGFYLRLTELWNVFDIRTGLPEPGAAITISLVALTIGFLLVCAVFAIRAGTKYTSQKGFDNAFGTESLAYPFVFTLFGVVWLGATVKYFIETNAGDALTASALYFVILSGLAALSALLFAIEIYQDPKRKMALALSVVPILFMCYWLILLYKQNASNPILLSYCYYCLAIIASTLSFYYTAGYAFKKPSPGKAAAAYLASIFFCFVTLADDHPVSAKLILAAIAAMNVVYSSMLIKNLQKKGT